MPAYREARVAYSSVDDGDDHEKQISVDPVSLKQLQLMAPPELVRPKFVSCSLPGSAVSSPRSAESPKKQHNARFDWEEANNSLRRSKSCGEGRSSSPAVEFIDIPSIRRSSIQQQQKDDDAERVDHVDDAVEACKDGNSFKNPRTLLPRGGCERGDDKFMCGCLFLPSLSHKKKQVVFRQTSDLQRHAIQEKKEQLQLSKVSFHGLQEARESAAAADKSRMSTVSKAASLEKFSCGSWSSSALLESDGGGRNSYFDLPLELIRGGHDETDSPVRAAFVFEKDLKGVLKKTSSNLGARKSHASASNRHVRFSVSAPTSQPASPSCITPRLRKARENFNAFLAAQDFQ